jgi:hypothetical protein
LAVKKSAAEPEARLLGDDQPLPLGGKLQGSHVIRTGTSWTELLP